VQRFAHGSRAKDNGRYQEQAPYPALTAFRDIEGCEPPPSVVDAIVERFLAEIRAPHNEVAAARS
jgi:hypothetical protein